MDMIPKDAKVVHHEAAEIFPDMAEVESQNLTRHSRNQVSRFMQCGLLGCGDHWRSNDLYSLHDTFCRTTCRQDCLSAFVL